MGLTQLMDQPQTTHLPAGLDDFDTLVYNMETLLRTLAKISLKKQAHLN